MNFFFPFFIVVSFGELDKPELETILSVRYSEDEFTILASNSWGFIQTIIISGVDKRFQASTSLPSHSKMANVRV